MMIHNQKNSASVVINVSCSTLARIKPVRDQHNNRYVGTESGHMNNDELIKFIEDIIVEHTQD